MGGFHHAEYARAFLKDHFSNTFRALRHAAVTCPDDVALHHHVSVALAQVLVPHSCRRRRISFTFFFKSYNGAHLACAVMF